MFRDKKKILIVDDEVHIVHVLSLKLRNAGYEVCTARDGIEALEVAQVEAPDLVLADYQVPRLSGLELCQRLKRRLGDVPAVIFTARGFALEQGSMAAAGVRTCLQKPFSPREVLDIVDSLLEPAVV